MATHVCFCCLHSWKSPVSWRAQGTVLIHTNLEYSLIFCRNSSNPFSQTNLTWNSTGSRRSTWTHSSWRPFSCCLPGGIKQLVGKMRVTGKGLWIAFILAGSGDKEIMGLFNSFHRESWLCFPRVTAHHGACWQNLMGSYCVLFQIRPAKPHDAKDSWGAAQVSEDWLMCSDFLSGESTVPQIRLPWLLLLQGCLLRAD